MQLRHILLAAITAIAATGQQVSTAPALEVASIRPAREGTSRSVRATPRGISYTRISLAECIAEAYKVRTGQISGPALLTAGYDIAANATGTVTNEQRRLMLQSLLTERFQLILHHESKDMAVYKQVIG